MSQTKVGECSVLRPNNVCDPIGQPGTDFDVSLPCVVQGGQSAKAWRRGLEAKSS